MALTDVVNRITGKSSASSSSEPVAVTPTVTPVNTTETSTRTKTKAVPGASLYNPQPPFIEGTGIPQEDAPVLNEYGYTNETVPAYWANDPSKLVTKPVLQQVYESTIKAPVTLTPEQEAKARAVAGLGQTFGSIAEMIGAGAGAHVSRRNFAAEPVAVTEGKVKSINDLYAAQQAEYDKGLAAAKGNDELAHQNRYYINRAEMLGLLGKKAASQAAVEQTTFERNMQQQKLGLDKRAQSQHEREFNYGVGKDKQKGTVQVIARADDRGKGVYKNAAGQYVRDFVIGEEGILQQANQAKKDKAFMDYLAKNTSMLRTSTKTDAFGQPVASTPILPPDEVLGQAYSQWQYDTGKFVINRTPGFEEGNTYGQSPGNAGTPKRKQEGKKKTIEGF